MDGIRKCVCIHIYRHVTQFSNKDTMNLKESKEGLEKGNGRES